jgi:RHS repeat-associated protein
VRDNISNGDQVGSSRTITFDNVTVCYDADFEMFGHERTPYVNTCAQSYRFEGMERDPEDGLDHTLFQQYASNLGRWLSPDSLAGSVANPQSLNRYAYVLDNPKNLVDSSGLCADGTMDCHPILFEASSDHCVMEGNVSSCGSNGVIFGNDIFDAISGAPGTYLTMDMYGNVGFGFSPELWGQTWNAIDAERNAVAALDVSVWRHDHFWLGLNPYDEPTNGYVVLQRDLGTPDINAQYSTTGLIPDLQNIAQESAQLGAMVPSDLQQQYRSRLGAWGPVDGPLNFASFMAYNYPGSPWLGYQAAYEAHINTTLDNMIDLLSWALSH